MSVSHGWWAMEDLIPGHGGWCLVFNPRDPDWPQLFRTRRECREYIEQEYGYIRERDDLKRMGFRVPRAVMVSIVKASGNRKRHEH